MSIENTQIQMINVNDINILNPRIRNKKVFNDISNNILKVGLKRPITVTKSDSNTHDKEYDLVCESDGKYILLDGHLRLMILKKLNIKKVSCLLANGLEINFMHQKRKGCGWAVLSN